MTPEIKLILQALTITISRKKRQLKREERLLLTVQNDYEQFLICKSITHYMEKIQSFETLKRKLTDSHETLIFSNL